MPTVGLWRKNAAFRALWLAGAISSLGDYVFLGALGVWVALLTGSPAKVGLVLAAETAGALIMGTIAGVWVDRWPKRRVMIAADLARAAILPLLLLVRRPGQFCLLMLVSFLLSALSRFFGPARAAILRAVVEAEDLTAANGLQQLVNNVSLLAGPAVGVWLVAEIGPAPVFLADAVSFLLSAALLRALPPGPASDTARSERFWPQFRSGLRQVRQERILLFIFAVAALVMAGGGALNALDTFFILRCLRLPARYIGIFNGIFVMGLLGGAALAAQRRLSRLGPWLLAGSGILGMGCCIALYAFSPGFGYAVPFLLGTGLGNGLVNATVPAIILRVTPPDKTGKVIGLFETILAATTLLSTSLAGVLAGWIDLRIILGGSGAVIAAAGLWALFAPVKEDRTSMPNQSPARPV